MLADSTKMGVDTLSAGGWVRKTDNINRCVYYIKKKKIYVAIWEIRALSVVNLKTIKFNAGFRLSNYKYESGELLDKGSMRETFVNFGPFFKDTINFDLDDNSKIYTMIEKENYRGFYGLVKKMAFENEKRDFLALIDYPDGARPILFLTYKANDSFYIIMINADVPFDESIIKMLNLK
jgi:hypothetical protein